MSRDRTVLRRVLKIVGLVLAVVVAFGIGWAWPILVRPPLVIGQDAITDAASRAVVPVVEDAGGAAIVARPPDGVAERDVLVVINPGGLVRPQAYEWLARSLASDGYLTVIPEFSFDLAVTDPDRADTLIARYGEGKKVVVAGHSLGGAMAAQYAADRERAGSGLAGLILMAAYPADSADLSGADLPVLSLLGENDQVVNRDALDAAAAAWTSGQVDAVMATFVHDEPLLVFLGDTPLTGPDSVRAALDARAAEPGGLGALSYEWFETLQFDVYTAVVSGRAVMTRDGKTHRGLFTRILRRTVDGWLIVHDQLAWGPEA